MKMLVNTMWIHTLFCNKSTKTVWLAGLYTFWCFCSILNSCHRSKRKPFIWWKTPMWPYFPDLMVTSTALTSSPEFSMKCMATAPLWKKTAGALPSGQAAHFSFHHPPSTATSSSCQFQGAPSKPSWGEWKKNIYILLKHLSLLLLLSFATLFEQVCPTLFTGIPYPAYLPSVRAAPATYQQIKLVYPRPWWPALH